MATPKYYNSTTGQWEAILAGPRGATGPQGPTGPIGPTGPVSLPTAVTVETAAGTASKVGTTSAGNYAPVAGDEIEVTFVNGTTANNPTLNIDGSGAVNIRLANSNASNVLFNLGSGAGSNIKSRMWFDGTYWQIYGSTQNNTYSEMSEAEIDAGTASSGRLISGRRAGYMRTSAMGVVVHGTNASAARPNNYGSVTWIGTVQPSNALANDIWYNG